MIIMAKVNKKKDTELKVRHPRLSLEEELLRRYPELKCLDQFKNQGRYNAKSKSSEFVNYCGKKQFLRAISELLRNGEKVIIGVGRNTMTLSPR
jgi:hypothetical protein